jgi:hypothetical protein
MEIIANRRQIEIQIHLAAGLAEMVLLLPFFATGIMYPLYLIRPMDSICNLAIEITATRAQSLPTQAE